MSRLRIKRPEPLPDEKKPLELAVRRNTAWAAGTEFFQHRDPLYHVTESFQQTFDAMGRRHAKAAGEEAGLLPQMPGGEGDILQREERSGIGPMGIPAAGQRRDISSAASFYEMKNPYDQATLARFSETAFQRGTMSGAVLRGTGRMMLFSCLKKTVGQSQPRKLQQRKLFDHASQLRNVPGHSPDQVIFNRGFVDSTVGIVVDTLRDARRTVDDMRDLVSGGLNATEAGAYGADTLREMYPFLDDSRERELLDTYYSKLRADDMMGPEERALIQGAVTRTRALMDKKARMRNEFMNKLRFLSDRATEALAEFEEPGFAAGLARALEEALAAEPPENGDEGGAGSEGGGGSSDQPENPGSGEGPSGTGG